MTYPRKIMKTTELVKECGFPYRYLLQMAHVRGQTYATKLPGGNHIYWDTEKFEKERMKHLVR